MKEMRILETYPMYGVTCTGKVWSFKRQIWISSKVTPNGYEQVTIRDHKQKRKTLYVHRMVADLFCNGEGAQVNHKDGTKLNNHYSNLEWCTASDNRKHAFNTGLQVMPKGTASPNAKFTSQVRRRVHLLREKGLLQREIAVLTGMSRSNVGLILKQPT